MIQTFSESQEDVYAKSEKTHTKSAFKLAIRVLHKNQYQYKDSVSNRGFSSHARNLRQGFRRNPGLKFLLSLKASGNSYFKMSQSAFSRQRS